MCSEEKETAFFSEEDALLECKIDSPFGSYLLELDELSKVKLIALNSTSMTARGHHLPYGITQCYLLLVLGDTQNFFHDKYRAKVSRYSILSRYLSPGA